MLYSFFPGTVQSSIIHLFYLTQNLTITVPISFILSTGYSRKATSCWGLEPLYFSSAVHLVPRQLSIAQTFLWSALFRLDLSDTLDIREIHSWVILGAVDWYSCRVHSTADNAVVRVAASQKVWWLKTFFLLKECCLDSLSDINSWNLLYPLALF